MFSELFPCTLEWRSCRRSWDHEAGRFGAVAREWQFVFPYKIYLISFLFVPALVLVFTPTACFLLPCQLTRVAEPLAASCTPAL
jgi:hypothetical protein